VRNALVLALLLTLGLIAVPAFAATKTYQVTGPVLEVRPDAIVVQKGSEKWEVARDSSTKVTGDLKVGSKVTITYRMTASDVTVKPDTAKPTTKKK
jgi:heme/copper-type cytochrome/quinol oxidase subunit 2